MEIKIPTEIEELSRIAVDAAFKVHQAFGPGLLESAYQQCFCYELQSRGIAFENEVVIPLCYNGQRIDAGFRADVLIKRKLLIELKATEKLLPIHTAQVITYLRILDLPLGLLINFNESLIKNGIHRVLNLRSRAA